MDPQPNRLEATVYLALRVALLLILAAAPWPFGSVTAYPAAWLTSSLLMLCGVLLAVKTLYGRSLAAPHLAWVGAALALLVVQQVPLPPTVVGSVAPAIRAIYAPLHDVASIGTADTWHPLTVEPFQSRLGWLRLLGLAAAFYTATQLFTRGRDRRLFAYSLTAVGVALSLFAVYQKARWGGVLYGRFPVASATPFGPFVSHNHFAGFVEASALVAAGAALGTARRHPSLALLLGGAATMMGIAHLLSHSRGGLIAVVVGLIFIAGLSQAGQLAKKSWIGVGVVAVAIFVTAFAPRSLFTRISTLANAEEDVSVQFRLNLWRSSFQLAADSPWFGTGLGTYAAVIPSYRTGLDETRAEFAESDWIQIGCETGVVGFLIAAGFVVAIARRVWHHIRQETSHRGYGLSLGASAAVVALVVHGLYDFNLHIPSNGLLFALLLGLLAAPHTDDEASATPTGRRWVALVLVLIPLVLTAYTMTLAASRNTSDRIDPLLVEPEDFSDSIQTLQVSLQSVPCNPENRYLLGRLFTEEAYRSEETRSYRELRFEQAEQAFREAVRRGPARGRFWFELAWTKANQGNDGEADALFARALRLEPSWSNLRANFALYLASRRRYEEALEQLLMARELEPGISSFEAISVLGPYVGGDIELLRRASGTGEEAERALQRYLADDGASSTSG